MTIAYAIKCLELMGEFTVKRRFSARAPLVLFPRGFVIGIPIQSNELTNFTIQELVNREDVMERVVRFTQYNLGWEAVTQNKDTGHYWSWTDDAEGDPVVGRPHTYIELIELAIELGITPEELLGVTG